MHTQNIITNTHKRANANMSKVETCAHMPLQLESYRKSHNATRCQRKEDVCNRKTRNGLKRELTKEATREHPFRTFAPKRV